MSTTLDTKKKSRSVLRSAFTRATNELQQLLSTPPVDLVKVKVTWEVLASKYEGLKPLNEEIYEILLTESNEQDLLVEMDSCDMYMKRFIEMQIGYDALLTNAGATVRSSHMDEASEGIIRSDNSSTVSETPDLHQGKRKFKLPTIEFKHYDGNIKDWLSFWAQFKKVHDDPDVDKHDKIEYLRQATVAGSRARQLVDSFPAMADNYDTIIESMKSRFGREDLQIEVYIRELLKLIIVNSIAKQKTEMSTLYDNIETQLRALETLGITSDKCSAIIYPLIESCLPQDLLRAWQRSRNFNNHEGGFTAPDGEGSSSLEIRLKNLMSFLRQEVENEQRISLAAEGFGLAESLSSVSAGENHTRGKRLPRNSLPIPTATDLVNCEIAMCVFCGKPHDSSACIKAQKMTYEQKRKLLADKRSCFRCLKVGHQAKKCRGRLNCVLCQRSHVVLMCPELPINKDKRAQINNDQNESSPPKDQALANQTCMHVFLQTVRVTLKGVKDCKVVRALIDSGSQRSYILKTTALQLGYRTKRSESIVHCLFGATETLDHHCCYDVTIGKGNYSFTFEALDQSAICSDLSPVFYGPWTAELKALGIEISDSEQPGPIELLLGADIVGSLYTGQRRKLPCGIIAFETHVGWTLMGKAPSSTVHSKTVMTSLSLLVKNASISELWDLETLGIKEPSDRRSKQDTAAAAKELFLQTIDIDQEGRYQVRLPWLDGHPPLPSNFDMAHKRLQATVRRLIKDNRFGQYDEILLEWEAEGIIEYLGTLEDVDASQGHYLPHRPVLEESSATTKIRPVFDASAHENGRPSLNHCLEKGLNLIETIPAILLRFREGRIGVVSDIRKAFLQISIHEKDRDFLRFLWLNEQGQEIILRHKRVVFGVNSSPFLLGATLEYHLDQCLQRCAMNNTTYSCGTVNKLSQSFYVDNCVASLPDEESLQNFVKEATFVMAEGQFELCGWEHAHVHQKEHTSNPCPVLGLNWFPDKDILTINPDFLTRDTDIESTMVTKRQILAMAQKVFDPIGFSCPAVLLPKLLLQKLWEAGLGWDQPVGDSIAQSFKKWSTELPYLSRIEIPRWILVSDCEPKDMSLHTFCDASKEAFACVIFLRVVRESRVSLFLMAAKTRVAPLKRSTTKMTIPRLELLAATIGARLYAYVSENLKQEIPSFFWSDSSTVVSWIIRKEDWKPFVWNRISEIRNLTSEEDWHHLPGIYNPADLPSRGCSPKQLFNLKWWEGPKWLCEDPDTWPSVRTIYDEEEISTERKKKLVITLVNINISSELHLNYFSQYNKTVRMMAWIFRFLWNCRRPEEKRVGEIDCDEFVVAEKFLLKLIQQESFHDETNEKISTLSPFSDKEGIIRLKSRVSNREDSEDYRFPIVLPSKHALVHKLIMDSHIKLCHIGVQGLLSKLRERLWILRDRRTIRSVIGKCMVCKRHNVRPLVMEYPPLPLDRVRDAVAFEITGIDFAGPLYLKGGDKAWICLFTCAVVRAVHLELTTSLSTASFLQALRRFVARRGRPRTIYSDNGSNFKGAENAMCQLDWDKIMRETGILRIQWRFKLPTAAW